MSPGKRVDKPTIAMSSLSTSRDQSKESASSSSSSGSPSMMTVASDSMVGWRNATVAVSVTPVRSSMSLAIATASREDRPSSTIGVESSIASADWPVALAIQLRSQSRISGTVMSVRRRRRAFSRLEAGADSSATSGAAACSSPGVVSPVASPPSGCCESSSVSAMFRSPLSPSAAHVVGCWVSVSPFDPGTRWPPCRCAGCRPGRRRGRRGGRSCRSRSAGSPRRGQQHVAHGDTVAHRDRGADVVGDRRQVELVRARRPLTDDHQLFEVSPGRA